MDTDHSYDWKRQQWDQRKLTGEKKPSAKPVIGMATNEVDLQQIWMVGNREGQRSSCVAFVRYQKENGTVFETKSQAATNSPCMT